MHRDHYLGKGIGGSLLPSLKDMVASKDCGSMHFMELEVY